jgi:hypothetical protein
VNKRVPWPASCLFLELDLYGFYEHVILKFFIREQLFCKLKCSLYRTQVSFPYVEILHIHFMNFLHRISVLENICFMSVKVLVI